MEPMNRDNKLSRKEEAAYRAGVASVLIMTAAGFVLYMLFFRYILRTNGMITYGLDMIGMLASVFIFYGIMTSRNINGNCSKDMARILILADVILLFDVVLILLASSIRNERQIERLVYPLMLVLLFWLWRYVYNAIPGEHEKILILDKIIRIYVRLGIIITGIISIVGLFYPDTASAFGNILTNCGIVITGISVVLLLAAVNIQVIASGCARLQKIFALLASLFVVVFEAAGYIGAYKRQETGSFMVLCLAVLLISGVVFPARLRIQEIISRVFAIFMIIAVLIYGEIYIYLFYEIYSSESDFYYEEVLLFASSVMKGTTPDEVAQMERGGDIPDNIRRIVLLSHDTLVFTATVDDERQEWKDVTTLNRNQYFVKNGRYYPDINVRSILPKPDTIFHSELTFSVGDYEWDTVLHEAEEETLILAFSHWEDPDGNEVGIIGVCAFPERWRVQSLSELYLMVLPVLFLIMAGALILSFMIDRKLIMGLNQMIDNIKTVFAGGEWSESMAADSASYESSYFSRIIPFLIQDLKEHEKSLTSEIKERERINADLNLAAEIQAGILPNKFPPYPDRHEFSIFARMHPARVVGGDFYDFYFLDPDHLALLVADVSGKGIPASLFMMRSRSILRSAIRKYRNPASALEEANRQLAEDNKERMFVTVWTGILEISTGRLTEANAGHERLLINRGGTWEYSDGKKGSALGLFVPADGADGQEPSYFNNEVYLNAGDMLFQCTDGVWEAVSPQKKFFGEKRLLETLKPLAGCEPEKLVDEVNNELEKYRGTEKQFDDITMLSLLYKGVDAESTGVSMDKKNWISIKPERAAFSLVRERIMKSCPSTKEAKPCVLVCDEIFQNIIEYSGACEIWFFCEDRGTSLEIGFMDDGIMFDPVNEAIREKEFKELSGGGMGMTLIRTLARNLRYERAGERNVLYAEVETGDSSPGDGDNNT